MVFGKGRECLPPDVVPAILDDFVLAIKEKKEVIRFPNYGLVFYMESFYSDEIVTYTINETQTIEEIILKIRPWIRAGKCWIHRTTTDYTRTASRTPTKDECLI